MAIKIRKNDAWVTVADTPANYKIEGTGTDGSSFGTGEGAVNLYKNDSTTAQDTISIKAGPNIKIEKIDDAADFTGGFKISADSGGGGSDTTYTLPVFGNANGASGIKLEPDGSGTASDAQIVQVHGAGTVSVVGSGAGTEASPYKLTITGASSSGNEYEIKGNGTDANLPNERGSGKIELWKNNETTAQDTVTITAGSNITINGTGETGFTINAVAGASVGIDVNAADVLKVTNSNIGAQDAGSNKIVFWDDDGGQQESGELTYLGLNSSDFEIDSSNQLNLVAGAGGKTYNLTGGGADTNPAANPPVIGVGKIILTGNSSPEEVAITAGTNIRISDTGNSGFTIHADDVDTGAFKFANLGTGSGTGKTAVFALYGGVDTNNYPNPANNQKITITAGSGIKFSGQATNTNSFTQTLTIEAETQAAGTLNITAASNQSGPLLFVTSAATGQIVYADTKLKYNSDQNDEFLTVNNIKGGNAGSGSTWPGNKDYLQLNASHLRPSENATSAAFGQNLGSDTKKWNTVYARTINADFIGGNLTVNTSDKQVLFTEELETGEKVAAGSDKFKWDNQLEISGGTSGGNYIHLTQDAGIEIQRTTDETGTAGGAFIDFRGGISTDFDARIQLITSAAGAAPPYSAAYSTASGKVSGGLLFYGKYNNIKAAITDDGVFGISGSAAISNNRSGFCPGYPSESSIPNNFDPLRAEKPSKPYVLDVNGKAFFRVEDSTTGVEGGQITLEGREGTSTNPGWTFDIYSHPYSEGARNDSNVKKRRFRILSEDTLTTKARADELFCMNQTGSIAFAGRNFRTKNSLGQWVTGFDDHGNNDYGAPGAVLVSQGNMAPPIWSADGSGASTASSPIMLQGPVNVLRTESANTDYEGSAIFFQRTKDATEVIELDVFGQNGDYNFRIVDIINSRERLRISATGAWGLSGFAAYGSSGQVLMSRGNSEATTWSHLPKTGDWWNTLKESVPVIDVAGVMEIGRYLDFHSSLASGSDYDARIENDGNGTLKVYNSISSASDRRIKDNLDIISSPLDKVGIITGYTFNYTNTEEKTPSAGLIAQDVEKILPDLVSGNDEEIKSLNYNGITALLVEAVKELKAKNTALEARIAALESS